MVIRMHDYRSVKEVDERLRLLVTAPDSLINRVEWNELQMVRGELEVSQEPLREPRHRREPRHLAGTF